MTSGALFYLFSSTLAVSWDSFLTATLLNFQGGFTDATRLLVQQNAPSGEFLVTEAYLDVYYAAQPTVSITAPTGTHNR